MAPMTYILTDRDQTNVVPTVTYVLRDSHDGEVFLKMLEGDTRDHDSDRDTWEAHGTHILAVIEGERDLSNGDATAWVRF